MKTIKIINFLKYNKNKSQNIYLYTLIIIVISFTVCKTYIGNLKIKELETFINENYVDDLEEDSKSVKEDELITAHHIKRSYDLLGLNNISKLTINENQISIDGICGELITIENLKDEYYIKNLSVNSIRKQENNYLYNLSYQVGD